MGGDGGKLSSSQAGCLEIKLKNFKKEDFMDFSSLYVKEGRAISRAKGALLIAESIPGIDLTR